MTAHQIINPIDRILDAAGYDWTWAFVIFREVPDWPGYLAGSQGHVFSCRTNGGKLGEKWHFKCPTVARDGYLLIKIHRRGETRYTGVHAVVLSAFSGPRPDGMQVRHKNGVRTDNRPSNLLWGTSQQNIDDREKHGATARGERNGQAKLTSEKVREIHRLRAAGLSLRCIGLQVGISKRAVLRVVHKQTWSEVR